MSITFTRTRTQMMNMILGKLGVLGTGQTASAEDSGKVYEALDLRLKEMHRLGIFWRKVTKTPLSFTLSANTTAASASNDVLFPVKMTFTNNGSDFPIEIVDIRNYNSIEDKTATGDPQKVLHNGSSSFLFWPVPITDRTIKLVYEKVTDDTASGQPPDLDVSMMRWMKDIVAYDLADDYGIPETTVQRWRQESIYAELQIRKLSAQNVDNETVRFSNL